MRRPSARKLLAGLMDLVDLRSRAELVHVLGCSDCELFDSYDGGGRGHKKPGGAGGGIVPEIWSRTILASLQRHLVYGQDDAREDAQ